MHKMAKVTTVKRVQSVQRAFTKKLPDMNSWTYRERLSVLRLESLELRRMKADLIMCFKILKGFTNIDLSEFLRRQHAVLEVIVWNCIIPILEFLLVKISSLFAWFKYGIIYQTKLYQLPVSVLLNPS